jgi:hypothetical protein
MEWVAKWLWKSYDPAFGCHHRNLSRAFTIERRTYRVCCSCGVKFTYSLENMSVERHVPRTECQTVALAARLGSGLAMISTQHPESGDRVSDRQCVRRNNNFASVAGNRIKCRTPALVANDALAVLTKLIGRYTRCCDARLICSETFIHVLGLEALRLAQLTSTTGTISQPRTRHLFGPRLTSSSASKIR